MLLRNIARTAGRTLGNFGGVLKAFGNNDAVRKFGQTAAKVASTGLSMASPALLAAAPELAPALPIAQRVLGKMQGNSAYNVAGAVGSGLSALGKGLSRV